MKAYTDLEQSKKLAEILPLESADMTLPFRHTQKDEYIPEHVGTRSYIDVYNEMIALPGMDKEQVCKLIQPCWSLAALLGVLPSATLDTSDDHYCRVRCQQRFTEWHDNPIDTCYEMILKLHELNLL